MAKIEVELKQNALGGVNICVLPKDLGRRISEAAACGGVMTAAESYAVAALNFIRDNQDTIGLLERPKKIKKFGGGGHTVDKVNIVFEDKANGGASCVAVPPFSIMAGMVASGQAATLTQKTALLLLGRVAKVGREARGGPRPGESIQ